MYLLFTWQHQDYKRGWTDKSIEEYGHKSHLPYQLRAFNALQLSNQRMINLGKWPVESGVKTSDNIPITIDFMQSAFSEAMKMIDAYEKSLHMPFAKTVQLCELSEKGQWSKINNMIVSEQNGRIPELQKHQIPWLLGLEQQGQEELKRVHLLWKEVREHLAQNGSYCKLPPYEKWIDLPTESTKI